jgi:hypothetical protein
LEVPPHGSVTIAYNVVRYRAGEAFAVTIKLFVEDGGLREIPIAVGVRPSQQSAREN